jgi:hypothetical protein
MRHAAQERRVFQMRGRPARGILVLRQVRRENRLTEFGETAVPFWPQSDNGWRRWICWAVLIFVVVFAVNPSASIFVIAYISLLVYLRRRWQNWRVWKRGISSESAYAILGVSADAGHEAMSGVWRTLARFTRQKWPNLL